MFDSQWNITHAYIVVYILSSYNMFRMHMYNADEPYTIKAYILFWQSDMMETLWKVTWNTLEKKHANL